MRPKVVSHYLLEKMRLANVKKVYIILREGKWDIPAYYRDGKILDMHVAYLMMGLPFGVPYTLDQAYPFIEDPLVALGFPDSIIQPENAFVRLLEKQEESNADVVLGLFPTAYPHKNEMVEIGPNGQIRSLDIKLDQTEFTYAWEIAIWTPVFTRFMHEYVSGGQREGDKKQGGQSQHEQRELHVGDVIQAAIQNDLQVNSVLFKEGSCLDIGTPEDMMLAVKGTYQ